MGGCFSVSLSCDQVLNQTSQWLCLKGSYIHDLAENLASLDKAMGVLKAKRDDKQERVNREEFTGQNRRLAQVQVWLTSVLTIENQYNDLIVTSELEFQRLCLCGFCSKDFKSSYHYGKKVILMLREVENLSSQGEFDVVTEALPIAQAEELPTQPTIVGQEKMLEAVWNRLMDDKVGIVGLYGMGGVGKTTLLTQINNKFSEIDGRFDVVIWVVVSKNATVHKIQGGIGKKLGLEGKEWEEKDENQRAIDIHKVLKRKKFLLLLDDIWEKVILNVVGVPYPNRKNGCKVAFTTRSRDVCGRMEVDDPMEVSCLDPEKSWELFKKKVGERTLENHPDIQELARKVAGKCRGLPLALNVIGEAMACKRTIQEWHQAVDILTSSATEFSGMVEEILPILKYSYDSLKGGQVKSCFLYCSLFPEDYSLEKERLIEYWIGEGIIDEKVGREKALNQGYGIIGSLTRACLLLEEIGWDDKLEVKMHDVVRDMALWIASDLGNWKSVRRISMTKNDVRMELESHECPELTTLLLKANKSLATILGANTYLATISSEFFRCMPRLLVLDLSGHESLTELPEEISGLVSLRYLDLSGTHIKRLSVGLQQLKMLIYLNLESTTELESLQGISNFWSLRTLKLVASRVWLDISLMKELQLLQHLEFVSVTISSSMVGKQLLFDSSVAGCIQHMFISERSEESVRVLNLPAMDNLREVYIDKCGIWEIKIEKRALKKSLTTPCFSNLNRVIISECDGLKNLTWLLFALNLSYLAVLGLKNIKEIISEEKTWNILPFQRLEVLMLFDLPELKSIYWNALPFQHLKSLRVGLCPKLRKLPLDSKSVGKVENLVIEYGYFEKWIERIEWEDEATQQRFLPRFKKYNEFDGFEI